MESQPLETLNYNPENVHPCKIYSVTKKDMVTYFFNHNMHHV